MVFELSAALSLDLGPVSTALGDGIAAAKALGVTSEHEVDR